MEAVKNIVQAASEIGTCDKFRDSATLQHLIEQFFEPQSIEFCKKHNFPNMEMFEQVKGIEAIGNGMYVNTPVKMRNAEKIALIGIETIAELEYDDNAEVAHHVIVMHGAKVTIKASNYAVVFVNNLGGQVIKEIRDYAKVV